MTLEEIFMDEIEKMALSPSALRAIRSGAQSRLADIEVGASPMRRPRTMQPVGPRTVKMYEERPYEAFLPKTKEPVHLEEVIKRVNARLSGRRGLDIPSGYASSSGKPRFSRFKESPEDLENIKKINQSRQMRSERGDRQAASY
jgi:hypothetical protein